MCRLLSLAITLVLFASAHAKDPLRFLPESTDVVLKVEKPRALVEAILKHDLAKEGQNLQIVRDFLDGANARKVFQLLSHFEKELGAPWPELIDKLMGDGIAAGLNFGSNNAPATLILQGQDEKVVAKFMDLGLALFEEELAQQGVKEKPARKTYAGVEVVQLDKELLVARMGDALVVATKSEAMKLVLDQNEANAKNPKAKNAATGRAPVETKKSLPGNPHAWLWVNMKPIKELPQAKDLFATPRNEVILTLIAAGYLDVARRSDYIAAGLYHDAGDFRISLRMPAGREGMATDVELHLPRDPKVGGSLPLLEPKGVVFSHSFYLDLDTLYKKREEIFPPQSAKDFEEGEKQISRVLLGTTLPKFLSQAGVHYRLVALQPEKVESYKTEPSQRLPAFAIVISMREPGFAKTMTGVIRAAVVALGQQVSLRSWDEEIAGIQTFGYSFPEKGKFTEDPQGYRFNYQPTIGVVQDQYVIASNKGIFKELVGLIQKEDRTKPMSQNMQMRVHANGLGYYLYGSLEQTLAGVIVGQGLKVGEAKLQAEALFAYLQKLGSVSIESDYGPKEFRFDLVWKTKK
ncbi:MAG: hypothetical protein EXS09_06485 [Gemmataceae bacterium]|nr:hypothetical protein [Gemmataceae bacterium]